MSFTVSTSLSFRHKFFKWLQTMDFYVYSPELQFSMEISKFLLESPRCNGIHLMLASPRCGEEIHMLVPPGVVKASLVPPGVV